MGMSIKQFSLIETTLCCVKIISHNLDKAPCLAASMASCSVTERLHFAMLLHFSPFLSNLGNVVVF